MEYTFLTIDGAEEIQKKYNVSALCAKVCAAKQLTEEQIMDVMEDHELCDPMLASGMQKVIDRLHLAKENKEKVLVCGDYDADGICATTILYDALIHFGIEAGFYIPNRFREGYGLHPNTVEMALKKEYSLLITVDNGVKAMAALQLAHQHHLDVIVSDHHTMDEEFPCFALLHPVQMGDAFQYLSGAGVALEISRALLGEKKEHVVLACIASIADVMPLWKETRTIVRKGLQYLKEGICTPIQLLSNDAYPKWDERMISFQVVPKLNTTGRLADLANANNTVRYLLMQDRTNMIAFVKQINELNNKRRNMSTKMTDFARSLVDETKNFQVLYHEDFHEGLVGLAAGKLAEEFQQPIMLLAGEEDLKGSIRSYGNVDLRDFFEERKELLNAYGGHKAAAGIGLSKDNLEALKSFVYEKMETYPIEQEAVKLDVIQIQASQLTIEDVEELECLGPFGEGFRKPIFYIEDYLVSSIRELSGGKHVRWESELEIDALFFNAKDVYTKYQEVKQLNFLGSLSINRFRNIKKVNIFVDDVIS